MKGIREDMGIPVLLTAMPRAEDGGACVFAFWRIFPEGGGSSVRRERSPLLSLPSRASPPAPRGIAAHSVAWPIWYMYSSSWAWKFVPSCACCSQLPADWRHSLALLRKREPGWMDGCDMIDYLVSCLVRVLPRFEFDFLVLKNGKSWRFIWWFSRQVDLACLRRPLTAVIGPLFL